MKSKYADYGYDVDMTYARALRVIYWRLVKDRSWREIAYYWSKDYPQFNGADINGSQLYGMTILDCAARKVGFSSGGCDLLYK